MNKVYCKNCRYHGWDNLNRCFDGFMEKFLELDVKGWSNRNYDCPHYERKWWKFWVA